MKILVVGTIQKNTINKTENGVIIERKEYFSGDLYNEAKTLAKDNEVVFACAIGNEDGFRDLVRKELSDVGAKSVVIKKPMPTTTSVTVVDSNGETKNEYTEGATFEFFDIQGLEYVMMHSDLVVYAKNINVKTKKFLLEIAENRNVNVLKDVENGVKII